MVMKKNEFYSVVLKKRVIIPSSKIRQEIRNKRLFAVGKYKVGKKEYEAWKILSMAKGKRKWKNYDYIKKLDVLNVKCFIGESILVVKTNN